MSEDDKPMDDSPQGLQNRWTKELDAAKAALEKWHTQGEKVLEAYLDERKNSNASGETRWNLFHANITTLRAMLYGRPPQVTVSRRFADAQDDEARVAGEMLERLLNTDIETDGDGFTEALQNALEDRLLPGMGCVRVRYEVETELGEETPAMLDEATGRELAPAVPAQESKSREDVETDYVPWRDFLWSPARVWSEVRWVAFRSDMSREAMVKRFGEDVARVVPLNSKGADGARDANDSRKAHPWDRASVWEVWDKDTRKVLWLVRGHSQPLDVKDDTLGLDSFFPCPKPMLANCTTSKVVPRPDYVMAQDLYTDINTVSTRITLLQEAIRVTGVYDKSNPEVKNLLSRNSTQNQLYPADNWAMFADKGGLRGVVDYFPLEQITGAMMALRDYRRELVDALYQVTGMSDIMRGTGDSGATATEQGIKARFGSVRVQALQDEFARFATDCQKLKAELVAKHFDEATIVSRTNMGKTVDAQLAPQAAALIKSAGAEYRVEVKPEAVSLQDFAALRNERTEAMVGLSTFLQAAGPLMQQMPAAAPYLLQMLQWSFAGFRGASVIEGALDQAIAKAQQAASQPQAPAPPDPKLLAQQMKGQQDMQKVQAELQADVVRSRMEVEADAQREQNQAVWNVREQAQKQQISDASKVRLSGIMPPRGGGR